MNYNPAGSASKDGFESTYNSKPTISSCRLPVAFDHSRSRDILVISISALLDPVSLRAVDFTLVCGGYLLRLMTVWLDQESIHCVFILPLSGNELISTQPLLPFSIASSRVRPRTRSDGTTSHSLPAIRFLTEILPTRQTNCLKTLLLFLFSSLFLQLPSPSQSPIPSPSPSTSLFFLPLSSYFTPNHYLLDTLSRPQSHSSLRQFGQVPFAPHCPQPSASSASRPFTPFNRTL